LPENIAGKLKVAGKRCPEGWI